MSCEGGVDSYMVGHQLNVNDRCIDVDSLFVQTPSYCVMVSLRTHWFELCLEWSGLHRPAGSYGGDIVCLTGLCQSIDLGRVDVVMCVSL